MSVTKSRFPNHDISSLITLNNLEQLGIWYISWCLRSNKLVFLRYILTNKAQIYELRPRSCIRLNKMKTKERKKILKGEKEEKRTALNWFSSKRVRMTSRRCSAVRGLMKFAKKGMEMWCRDAVAYLWQRIWIEAFIVSVRYGCRCELMQSSGPCCAQNVPLSWNQFLSVGRRRKKGKRFNRSQLNGTSPLWILQRNLTLFCFVFFE